MMRKEKMKKIGQTEIRRKTGWQGGEVKRMIGNEGECSSDKEEWEEGERKGRIDDR